MKLNESVLPYASLYFDRYFTTERLILELLFNRKIYGTCTYIEDKSYSNELSVHA